MPTTKDTFDWIQFFNDFRESSIHALIKHGLTDSTKLPLHIHTVSNLPFKAFFIFLDERFYHQEYYDKFVAAGVDSDTATVFARHFSLQHVMLKTITTTVAGVQATALATPKFPHLISPIVGLTGGAVGAFTAGKAYDAGKSVIDDQLSVGISRSMFNKPVDSFKDLIPLIQAHGANKLKGIDADSTKLSVDLKKFQNNIIPNLDDLKDPRASAEWAQFRKDSPNGKATSKQKKELEKWLHEQGASISDFDDEQINDLCAVRYALERDVEQLRQTKNIDEALQQLNAAHQHFGLWQGLGKAFQSETLMSMGIAGQHITTLLASAVSIGGVFTAAAFNPLALANPVLMGFAAMGGLIAMMQDQDASDPAVQYMIERIHHLEQRLEQFRVETLTLLMKMAEANDYYYKELSQKIEVEAGHAHQRNLQLLKKLSDQFGFHQKTWDQIHAMAVAIKTRLDDIDSRLARNDIRNTKATLNTMRDVATTSSQSQLIDKLTEHFSQLGTIINDYICDETLTGGEIGGNDWEQIQKKLLPSSMPNASQSLESINLIQKLVCSMESGLEGCDSKQVLPSFFLLQHAIVAFIALTTKATKNLDCMPFSDFTGKLNQLIDKLTALDQFCKKLEDPKRLEQLWDLSLAEYPKLKQSTEKWLQQWEDNQSAALSLSQTTDLANERVTWNKYQRPTTVMMPLPWRRPPIDSFFGNVVGGSFFIEVRTAHGFASLEAKPQSPMQKANSQRDICRHNEQAPPLYLEWERIHPDRFAAVQIDHYTSPVSCRWYRWGTPFRVMDVNWDTLNKQGFSPRILRRGYHDSIYKNIFCSSRYFFIGEDPQLQASCDGNAPRLIWRDEMNTLIKFYFEEYQNRPATGGFRRTFGDLNEAMKFGSAMIDANAKVAENQFAENICGTSTCDWKSIIQTNKQNIQNYGDPQILVKLINQSDPVKLNQLQNAHWISSSASYLEQINADQPVYSSGIERDPLIRTTPRRKLILAKGNSNLPPLVWPRWLRSQTFLRDALLGEQLGMGLIHAVYTYTENQQLTIELSFVMSGDESTKEKHLALPSITLALDNYIRKETNNNFGQTFIVNGQALLRSAYTPEEQLLLCWYGGYFSKPGEMEEYSYTISPSHAFTGIQEGYTLLHTMQYPKYQPFVGLFDYSMAPPFALNGEHVNAQLRLKVNKELLKQRHVAVSAFSKVLENTIESTEQLDTFFQRLHAHRALLQSVVSLLPQRTASLHLDWQTCGQAWWKQQLLDLRNSNETALSLTALFEKCLSHDRLLKQNLQTWMAIAPNGTTEFAKSFEALAKTKQLLMELPQQLCEKSSPDKEIKIIIENLRKEQENTQKILREIQESLSDKRIPKESKCVGEHSERVSPSDDEPASKEYSVLSYFANWFALPGANAESIEANPASLESGFFTEFTFENNQRPSSNLPLNQIRNAEDSERVLHDVAVERNAASYMDSQIVALDYVIRQVKRLDLIGSIRKAWYGSLSNEESDRLLNVGVLCHDLGRALKQSDLSSRQKRSYQSELKQIREQHRQFLADNYVTKDQLEQLEQDAAALAAQLKLVAKKEGTQSSNVHQQRYSRFFKPESQAATAPFSNQSVVPDVIAVLPLSHLTDQADTGSINQNQLTPVIRTYQ